MSKSVGVVGGRDFSDYKLLEEALNGLDFGISKIVSGGAPGADSLGVKYAKDNSIPFVEYLADWDRFKNRAGFMRNKPIVENSDVIVAFWDTKSTGTKDTIHTAIKMGKRVIIIRY